MQKQDIIFDSRDISYRKPSGAIRSGTKLELNICISDTIATDSVTVVMRYDKHEQPAYYHMERVECSAVDGYNKYHTKFPVHDRGLYWYSFSISSGYDNYNVGKGEKNLPVICDDAPSWQLTVYDRDHVAPEWIYGGIFYQIFVDRFAPSGRRIEMDGKMRRDDWGGTPEYRPIDGRIMNNDFFGGDLYGIIEKIPYLSDLGVTCIYLSPIFEAYSNHKYDTGDYEKVDAMFGDEDAFRKLCDTAFGYGIRIICDGVFAHTGSDSRYFNKYGNYGPGGAWNDPGSEYRDWYTFNDDGSYETWWGIDTLPRTNKYSAGFAEYIYGENGIIRKWLGAGASGWRFDVVDEYPAEFTAGMCSATKSEKADAILIGEVWEDASNKEAYGERKNYFQGDKLDSVMNYPLKDALIRFVRYGDAAGIAETVESIMENYPDEVINSLMNIVGSHDSMRLITALAGEEVGGDVPRDVLANKKLSPESRGQGVRSVKLVSAIQMTLPGVPCIYYGDETGMEGYSDPFNRGCFPWDMVEVHNGGCESCDTETPEGACYDLLSWYRKVTAIRRTHHVYEQGRYRTICAEDAIYAFARESDDDAVKEVMITAANAGPDKATLDIPGRWKDVLTNAVYEDAFDIKPYEVMILEQEDGGMKWDI